MIVNHIQNIDRYRKLLPYFDIIRGILSGNPEKYVSGRTDIAGSDVYVIRIDSEQPIKSANLLEVHRNYLDIHVTLKGTDTISYKHLEACTNIEKEFQVNEDYGLFRDEYQGILQVPEKYFCIIDPSIAHMALTGKGDVSKLVIKVKCN